MKLRQLTRHFFDGLLRPESVSGDDQFLEWLAQVLAVLIAASWIFPALLMPHYANLHALGAPDHYLAARRADFLMALLLTSLLVAVVVGIEWPMLFPSRRDHLVLSPLPLRRIEIFGAKLLALLAFISIFIGAIAVIAGVALPAVASGHWETRGLLLRAGAHLVAALAACYFVFFSLFAVQGVLLALLPGRWFAPVSFTAQSGLLLALLCSFPILPYFPASHLPDAAWLPPAWFLGMAENLMGEANPLGSRGAIALALAILVSLSTYALCYRRFSRFALDGTRGRSLQWFGRIGGGASGVREFIMLTLERGRDQKLVLLLILSLGLGLVLETGFYLARRVDRFGWDATADRISSAALGLPLILGFFSMVGLRRAFRLPADPPANWLFRLAETPDRRRTWLDAASFTLFMLGAVVPLAVCAPAEIAMLGIGPACAVLPWQALMLAAFGNYLFLGWAAVPFAATHNPARRHLLQSMVFHAAEFVPFVFGGATIIGKALGDWEVAIMWTLALAIAVYVSRNLRLRHWGLEPLEFEEPDPEALSPLRLQ